MGIDCNGAIPVQSHKCPRQRPRYHWDMDESWVCVVAEVEGGKVEEVDNQDDFSPDVVTTDEEHDERELEEVIDYEMASNTGSCIDIVGVGGEEVPDISNLQDEENDPWGLGQQESAIDCSMDIPVNRGNDFILGERSWVRSVYPPDGVTPVLNIIGW